MEIELTDARGNSCNFCKDGKLSSSGMNIIYPYDNVICISGDDGSGMKAFICPICYKQLIDKNFKVDPPITKWGISE